jgi:hypothetical protein
LWSRVAGVAHEASVAASNRHFPFALIRSSDVAPWMFCFAAVGVGHPIEPLPDVECARASSAQICRRSGVTCSFQISTNVIEPCEPSSAGNLLAKDAARAALSDEGKERRP